MLSRSVLITFFMLTTFGCNSPKKNTRTAGGGAEATTASKTSGFEVPSSSTSSSQNPTDPPLANGAGRALESSSFTAAFAMCSPSDVECCRDYPYDSGCPANQPIGVRVYVSGHVYDDVTSEPMERVAIEYSHYTNADGGYSYWFDWNGRPYTTIQESVCARALGYLPNCKTISIYVTAAGNPYERLTFRLQRDPVPLILSAQVFSVKGNYYYSNGSAYCTFGNRPQYEVFHGTAIDPEAIALYSRLPDMTFQNVCQGQGPSNTPGFFRVGAGVYYSNGSVICSYDSMANFTYMTGMQNLANFPVYSSLPSLPSQGVCSLLAHPGLIKAGDGIYYSNGTSMCSFENWSHFVLATGTTSTAGIPVVTRVPDMLYDGVCALTAPLGFFKVGIGVYYSNGAGAFCAFNSWAKFVAASGRNSTDGLPEYYRKPDLRDDGSCN